MGKCWISCSWSCCCTWWSQTVRLESRLSLLFPSCLSWADTQEPLILETCALLLITWTHVLTTLSFLCDYMVSHSS